MPRRAARRPVDDLDPMLVEFLLTGSYTIPPGASKWGIELSHSMAERRAAWLLHRDALLEAWKASGWRGQPWAEKEWGNRPLENSRERLKNRLPRPSAARTARRTSREPERKDARRSRGSADRRPGA
jgi:hypothetical protein